jgi:hypothetical protein
VEVLLAVVAVVAEVEDLVVGQAADGTIGVVVLGDMAHSPERPARA